MPETRAGQVASHLLSLHCCLGCAGGGREAAAQPGPWGHAPWAGVSAPAGSMCFQFLAYVSCLPVGTALSPSQVNLDSDSLRWEAEILFLFFFSLEPFYQNLASPKMLLREFLVYVVSIWQGWAPGKAKPFAPDAGGLKNSCRASIRELVLCLPWRRSCLV